MTLSHFFSFAAPLRLHALFVFFKASIFLVSPSARVPRCQPTSPTRPPTHPSLPPTPCHPARPSEGGRGPAHLSPLTATCASPLEVPLSQRCAPRFTCHAFVRHRHRARTLGPSMRVGLGPAHARSLIRDRGRGRGRDRGRARGRGRDRGRAGARARVEVAHHGFFVAVVQHLATTY